MSTSNGKQIASTILEQLGGNKFIVMTGSKNMRYGDASLNMQLTKNNIKAKYLSIELCSDDTYTMTFSKLVKYEQVILKEIKGVYCDMLQEIFTEVTGLYTSL